MVKEIIIKGKKFLDYSDENNVDLLDPISDEEYRRIKKDQLEMDLDYLHVSEPHKPFWKIW